MKYMNVAIIGLFALVGTAASHPGHGPNLGYGEELLSPLLRFEHVALIALAAVLLVVAGHDLFVNTRSGQDKEV